MSDYAAAVECRYALQRLAAWMNVHLGTALLAHRDPEAVVSAAIRAMDGAVCRTCAQADERSA
jgi:hypothetical protein